MIRKHTLTRSLVAALATTALAVPAAVAQPDAPRGPLPMQHHVVNAPGTDVGARDQQAPAPKPAIVHQDLRSPDTQDRAREIREARQSVPNLPKWPVDPKPIPRPEVAPVKDDGGTPWLTVGISLLVAALALAGSAGTAGRIRRRARVAA